jgi:transcription elongation factor Elf1
MAEPIRAKCDGEGGCGEDFFIKRFTKDKLKDGIDKTYFNCPSCGKEYLCFYTNKSIRDKQKKIRKMTNPLFIKKLRKDIAADMAELKMEVEQGT